MNITLTMNESWFKNNQKQNLVLEYSKYMFTQYE